VSRGVGAGEPRSRLQGAHPFVRCTRRHSVEFCWLCGQILGFHGMNHFFSLNGCTMYGTRRWDMARIKRFVGALGSPGRCLSIAPNAGLARRYRRWSPLALPLVLGGAAVAMPFVILALPPAVASEEFRTARDQNVGRGARCALGRALPAWPVTAAC
jgi:hypothetical protein